MKDKADTDDGWFKVANDVAQALARANLTANEYAVCLWVVCMTYGRKVKVGKEIRPLKTTPYSPYRIAADCGRNYQRVRNHIVGLLRNKVLVQVKNELGINTNIAEWTPLQGPSKKKQKILRGRDLPMGIGRIAETTTSRSGHRSFRPQDYSRSGHKTIAETTIGVWPERPQSPLDENVERARANVGDVGEKERGEAKTTPPSSSQQPPGTPRDWADRADPAWSPERHPGYLRLNFDIQNECKTDWANGVRLRAEDAENRRWRAQTAREHAAAGKPATPAEAARIIKAAFKGRR